MQPRTAATTDPKKKMPDVDLGIVIRHRVDAQQRLNCALPSFFLGSGFFRFQSLKRHVRLDDQLIHPKDLAVDLFNRSQINPSAMNLSLERR